MAKNKKDHDDFIVVADGSPRVGADGEDLTPPPATSSNSPAKSPSIGRTRRTARTSSQRRSDGGFNDTLDPLRAMPELRTLPWYPGKELPAEKSTESSRVQTRGACLLASRGIANDPPCNHCRSGVGRFSVCVSLEDWFHGACATCQLATRGNLCSLRTNKDSTVKSESERPESPDEEMPATSKVPASRRPRKSTNQSQSGSVAARLSTEDPPEQAYGTVRPDDEYRSQFGLKRKRESLQETSVYRPYVSPYAPLDPPNRFTSSLPNIPNMGSAPNMNMIIPANIARDHTAYDNYIREKERQSQQHNIASQPIRQAPSTSGLHIMNGNGYRPSPTVIESSRKRVRERELDRDRTESMSPSAQLLDPPRRSLSPERPIIASIETIETTAIAAPTTTPRMTMTTRGSRKKAATNGSATKPTPSAMQPNSSQALDPRNASLIDSLPRRKQKQIYGIISSLQSGIKDCQQYAEGMQKQLDLLQIALGIDVQDGKKAA